MSILSVFVLGGLTACSNSGSFSPIDWWHRQEGGKIAEDRPAPPGTDQPYPDLNTVPGRPTPPNQDEINKLTAALVADRTNAQHEAQATPMADPSSPSASPGLFGVGSAPPPGAAPPPAPPNNQAAGTPGATNSGPGNQSASATPSADAPTTPMASASMPAVTSPPPPPTPAPRKAVQSAPLEPPPPAAPAPPYTSGAATAPTGAPVSPATASAPTNPPVAAAPATPASAAAAQANANAPQPALPTIPPERPTIAGSPPPPVVTPPPMPEDKGTRNATIVFPEGSTTLSQPASAEVKAFAGKRGNGVIMVTGFGEAASADPATQSAAINMGLARAIAIAAALKEAGVPGPAIRVSAEATGRGASLVLLQ